MILEKNLIKKKSKDKIKLKCDYCGIEFKRNKSDFLRSRKIIQKDSCSEKKCISFKRKESNTKKYGVDNPTKNPKIKKKQTETLMKNYGVSVPANNIEIKNKIAKTNLNKYGNTCSLHGKKQKIATKKTWKKKYKKHHPFACKEVRKKIKDTMCKRYGKHYTQTKDYIDKTKKTCIERYGKEHFSQSEKIKQKTKETNLKKYGHEYPSQNDEIIKKILKSSSNKIKKYGKTQQEIKSYIEEITKTKLTIKVIERKEIDIFDPKKNIGIEYCGLRWHNEKSPDPRNKNYHLNKYKLCESEGIKLITIFEDEWMKKQKQCKNYLKSIFGKFKNRIFARKCTVREINKKISNKFYNEYHLFGKPNNTKVSFGIFLLEELIGCASIGYHHRDSSKTTINRICFKPDFQIIGGASKLIKNCVNWCKKNGCKKIITWSDNRWSNGNMYKKIGFELEKEIAPDYSYVDSKTKYKRVSKQSRKKNITNCPLDKTEEQHAIEEGFYKIWDCGKKRWILNVK
jgi:predicted GNAT family N-acyltransferase